jgi:excisionase family DNA binding protein
MGTTKTRLVDLPDVLRVEEVARILRIGRNAAYEGVRSGAIPSIKLGRSVRVPKALLERMLKEGGYDAGSPTPLQGEGWDHQG